MKKQKNALSYAKVQALYLLKIKAVETIRYLAVMMGRSESTIHYWLQLYRDGGIEKLLEEPPKTGRPKKRVGDAWETQAYPNFDFGGRSDLVYIA